MTPQKAANPRGRQSLAKTGVVPVSFVLKSKQNARVGLRRICVHGLEPARVRALGHLLGKRFCFVVAKDEKELLSVLGSGGQIDGLILSAGPSNCDAARLIQNIRSTETLHPTRAAPPIFVFSTSDDVLHDQDLEKLGVQGIFQKPGDIWRLAEAIHRDLGTADHVLNGSTFGLGPEAVILGAMKYIEQNLGSIRNSAEVSKHLGITREHLSRQFTKYTGQTLWDFVATCRVHRAGRLLRESDLLVKQISREVGFNCQSSFFRAFAKKTRLTPESFRCKISQARGKG